MRCRRRVSASTWKIAAGVVGIVLLSAGVAYIAFTLREPPRLGLPSGAEGSPGASPTASDPMAAACRRPVLPSATSTNAGSSLWLIQPGSVVGYRVREKFVQLPSPHEAIARTERISGWVLATGSTDAIQVETGCVAVDVATLKSVDSIPGYGTEGRDQIYGTLFETSRHPYVIFQPYPVSLSAPGDGRTVHVTLPGILEMRGVAKVVQFSIDVKRSNDRVLAAGSAPVDVTEYGLGDIEGPEGFVSIDPHCTLELSLTLLRA